jgi:hypothetical protein
MLKPGASICSASAAVTVWVPETPLIVARYDPRTAELLTVSVSTLLSLAGLVPNEAVTPVGKPETESVTAPVNPPTSCTAIVAVPLAPGLMLRLLVEADSWKPGEDGGASASISACPTGLPHPVTRSYPVTALNDAPW